MIEYLQRNFAVNVEKSHQFPEYCRSDLPVIHMLRNPWDSLWSTYQWFSTYKCGNSSISNLLKNFTFEQWLLGQAGPVFGYELFSMEGRDSLFVSRGMFYDPMSYWIAHAKAWSAQTSRGKTLAVQYENLVRDPQRVINTTAEFLELPVKSDSLVYIHAHEAVGHAPELREIGYSASHWTKSLHERLLSIDSDFLQIQGYWGPYIPGKIPVSV